MVKIFAICGTTGMRYEWNTTVPRRGAVDRAAMAVELGEVLAREPKLPVR